MDNYATFAEAMKPHAWERSGRKSSKAKPPRKRKQNRMKSSDDYIPRKQVAIHDSESDEDGEFHAVEARDENNPLDK